MEELNIYNQYMYSYPHKRHYNWIDQEVVIKALENLKNEELSLYFHIPFCSTKCGYCNLFSVTKLSLVDDYIKAICRQIEQYGKILKDKNISVNNVIFGGGTPFILSCENFERIFYVLEKYFSVNIKDVGFDIETSPKETDEEKLKYLISKGVNRISIGIQSFNDEELNSIKRRHSYMSCKNALNLLNTYRPNILNIDIIYGIPKQDIEMLKNTIDEALSYKPDEIFLYPLYIREGTGLANSEDMKSIDKYNLYLFASEYLKEKGFYQRSMRRYTKNLLEEESSCGFEQNLSFGCGGRSYINELHFCEAYETGTKACVDVIEKYNNKTDFTTDTKGYVLSKDEEARRFIIKNLGYYRGVSKNEYSKYFDEDLEVVHKELINRLILEGYIESNGNMIRLSEKGIGFSDYILPLFISEDVKGEISDV